MRRIVVALLVGVLVASVVYGMAASLDVFSDDLGAGSAAVEACDADGVNVSYTVAFAGPSFNVTQVTVDGIDVDACNGQEMTVVLSDSANAALYTGTATIASATETLDTSASTISAEAVTGVSVAITGDQPTTP